MSKDHTTAKEWRTHAKAEACREFLKSLVEEEDDNQFDECDTSQV